MSAVGRKMEDLTGHTNERLTVVQYKGKDDKGIHRWECSCSCGAVRLLSSKHAKSYKSCGCLNKGTKKHGYTGTKLYQVWSNMRTRVLNPNHPQYKDYGGRGITICDEWLNDKDGSSNFFKWAESSGYEEGLTLDRIDVDGDYEPSNCKWSTMQEQCFNRRSNVKYTFKGETKTATEWSLSLGGSSSLVRERIRHGWSIERALTEPVNTEYQHRTPTKK